jgi:alpha-L-arabinofuranosidase
LLAASGLGKPSDFRGLSDSASVKGKQLTVTVTNPHMTENRATEIMIRGARVASGTARVLSVSDVHAHNTFENPRRRAAR